MQKYLSGFFSVPSTKKLNQFDIKVLKIILGYNYM